MSDSIGIIETLRRPRLLLRAARYGLADYNRTRGLKRVLPELINAKPAQILSSLIEQEAALNLARKDGVAGYSPARHIDVLVALIFEARLFGVVPDNGG